jgi:hypothetical protein
MQSAATFKNFIEYTTLAASTAKEIADAAQVPFLISTAALTRSIAECFEVEIFTVVYILGLMRDTDCSFEQG